MLVLQAIVTVAASVLLLKCVEAAIFCKYPFEHALDDNNGCYHHVPTNQTNPTQYCEDFMDQTDPVITPRVTDIEFQSGIDVCFYFWTGTNPPTALTNECCGGGLPGRR